MVDTFCFVTTGIVVAVVAAVTEEEDVVGEPIRRGVVDGNDGGDDDADDCVTVVVDLSFPGPQRFSLFVLSSLSVLFRGDAVVETLEVAVVIVVVDGVVDDAEEKWIVDEHN